MNRYYKYPAVFAPDDDGWTVLFPDIDNCFTCSNTVEEAILEAQAVLGECLYFRERDQNGIPEPTPLDQVRPDNGAFVQIVVADMPPVRRAWSKKAVKKTLTIPTWMEEALQTREDINISAVLQDALKQKLKIQEPII